MDRGYKDSIVASVCGAILLAMVVISASAYQVGGRGKAQPQLGGDCNPDVYLEGGRGRGVPCTEGRQPPITNPGVKAKLDFEQNIKDAARLAQLAAEVKQELESSGEFTLSVASLKKAEEIENLSKRLHNRMKADNALGPKMPRVN